MRISRFIDDRSIVALLLSLALFSGDASAVGRADITPRQLDMSSAPVIGAPLSIPAAVNEAILRGENPEHSGPQSAECNSKREEMRRKAYAALKIESSSKQPISELDPAIVNRAIVNNCRMNLRNPTNMSYDNACESSYKKILDVFSNTDKFVGVGCGYLASAGEKIKRCKKEGAECYKAAAQNFKSAEKHLSVASNLLQQGVTQLQKLRANNRAAATKFAGDLIMIAARLRTLAAQGKQLSINDPDLDEKLNLHFRNNADSDRPVAKPSEILRIYSITSLDPDVIIRRGEMIHKEIEIEEKGHNPKTQDIGPLAFQQLEAAAAAHDTITFSQDESKRILRDNTQIRMAAARFEDLGEKFQSIPTAATGPKPSADPGRTRAGPGGPSPATQEPPPISRVASTNSPANLSSASSAFGDLRALGGQPERKPASLAAAPAYSPPSSVPAPRGAATPERSASRFGAGNMPASPRSQDAELRAGTEESSGEAEAKPASERHVIHETLVQSIRAFDEKRTVRDASEISAKSAAAPPQGKSAASPVSEAELAAQTADGETAGAAPSNGNEGETFAVGAAVDRTEKGHSLRDLLRKKLSDRRGPAASTDAASGADLLISEQQQAAALAELSPEELQAFSMNSSETEAEVRQLLSQIHDRQSAGILGASSASLFDRVRATYTRVAKRQAR